MTGPDSGTAQGCQPRFTQGCQPRFAQGCLPCIAWGCLLLRIAWGYLLLRNAWGCLLLHIAWGCLLLCIAWGCLLLRIAAGSTVAGTPPRGAAGHEEGGGGLETTNPSSSFAAGDRGGSQETCSHSSTCAAESSVAGAPQGGAAGYEEGGSFEKKNGTEICESSTFIPSGVGHDCVTGSASSFDISYSVFGSLRAIPSRKVSAASAPAAPAASAAVLPPEERAGQSVSEGGAPGSCLQASLAGVGAAEVPTRLGSPVDPRKVLIVAGHHNWIVVTYAHFVVCYRIKESSGWQQVFSSPYLDWAIERVALNAKVVGGPHGDKDKMVAVASESSIILWSIQDGGSGSEIGKSGY
ncbi:UNVERIFIED_CONTAM: hypothetical protein FKN15_027144 [Acipenser sinensis]